MCVYIYIYMYVYIYIYKYIYIWIYIHESWSSHMYHLPWSIMTDHVMHVTRHVTIRDPVYMWLTCIRERKGVRDSDLRPTFDLAWRQHQNHSPVIHVTRHVTITFYDLSWVMIYNISSCVMIYQCMYVYIRNGACVIVFVLEKWGGGRKWGAGREK